MADVSSNLMVSHDHSILWVLCHQIGVMWWPNYHEKNVWCDHCVTLPRYYVIMWCVIKLFCDYVMCHQICVIISNRVTHPRFTWFLHHHIYLGHMKTAPHHHRVMWLLCHQIKSRDPLYPFCVFFCSYVAYANELHILKEAAKKNSVFVLNDPSACMMNEWKTMGLIP